MLLLLTESTVEFVNVSMDPHHPFHTYNNHNRLRQVGFTQQNFIVNIDDVERDIELLNGKESF